MSDRHGCLVDAVLTVALIVSVVAFVFIAVSLLTGHPLPGDSVTVTICRGAGCR